MAPDDFREIRKASGLRQSDLAALIGVRPEHVSRIETGKMEVSATIALAMRAIGKFGHPEGW